jgi:hypothetical protein
LMNGEFDAGVTYAFTITNVGESGLSRRCSESIPENCVESVKREIDRAKERFKLARSARCRQTATRQAAPTSPSRSSRPATCAEPHARAHPPKPQ